MHDKATQENRDSRLIFFDVDKTLINPFAETVIQAEHFWNEVIKPKIEQHMPDNFPKQLAVEDLEKYTEYGSKGRLLLHRLYVSMRDYQRAELKAKSIMQDEQQESLIVELEHEKDRCAKRARSVFSEIIENKYKEYISWYGHSDDDKGELISNLRSLYRSLRGDPAADGHSIINKMQEQQLNKEVYYTAVMELIKKLHNEGHIIGIITRRTRRDIDDPKTVFKENAEILRYINKELIFTKEDGDKKIYGKNKGAINEKPLSDLVATIRDKCAELGFADKLPEAVHIGDMHHDVKIAWELGCNMVRVEYGQDKRFLEQKLRAAANKEGKKIEAAGKHYEIVPEVVQLKGSLQKMGLLHNRGIDPRSIC